MKKLTIRVSDELAARLAEAAKAAHRSINGHVIHLIEQDVKAAAAAKKETQDT